MKLAGLAAAAIALTASVAAAAETTYEYDDFGRLKRAVYDDGSTVEYHYDVNDNRSQLLVAPPPPTFLIDDVSVSEGGNLSFTVTKTGATSQSYAVSYATANGTASAGDYTAASGTLTFTAGQTTKTVTVATVEDAVYEAGETVLLNLSNATNGATISDSQGVGTITNDDAAPAFSVNDVSVSEGGNLSFTVTKTGATSQSHAVSYATANGTASASDYTAASGTLTFTAGQTSKTVTVATVEDAVYEAGETVLLNLSNVTNGATISDSQGVGTITNDDAAPAFSVNDVSVSEGGNLSFTVTKTGATSQSHAVSYATANGTASASDYTTTSGTLTFTAGQTTKTVTVATVEDSAFEPNETVLLNLSGPTNGATISDNQGVGVITNDDANTAPNASDDFATTQSNQTITINVLVNDTDADGDSLSITSVTTPEHGNASIINGGQAISYHAPTTTFTTFDLFTYTVSDGNGGTDTANVSVNVQGGGGGGPF